MATISLFHVRTWGKRIRIAVGEPNALPLDNDAQCRSEPREDEVDCDRKDIMRKSSDKSLYGSPPFAVATPIGKNRLPRIETLQGNEVISSILKLCNHYSHLDIRK